MAAPEELSAGWPLEEGELTLPGLEGPASVYRDEDGIPHIRAATERDAFYVQGFVHAQDRMWHMDADRHRAYGRWAEWVGPGGVEQDVLARKLRLGTSARLDYESVNAPTRAMLDRYAAGVNAYLQLVADEGRLPVEYRILGVRPEPWQPWDSLAVYKIRHVLMGTFQTKLARARLLKECGPETTALLFREYAPGEPVVLPPAALLADLPDGSLEEFFRAAKAMLADEALEGGSNNWVVAGARTASGKPLVAGDPHRALDTPNVYYQNHVSCPEFDVIGLSFPGVPGFPHFGHNAFVAWCVTHGCLDYQDLYIERFHPEDPAKYLFRGEWRRAEVYDEEIAVRGARSVTVRVTVTGHGPVVAGDPRRGKAIALRYTATSGPNRGFEAVHAMLRARSAGELDESMRSWVDPGNNFVFADVHGETGYRTRGRVPIRPRANGWLPVPGWTGEYEWEGFVPFEEMPHARNPETGFLGTANNRIVGPEYPYYLSVDYAAGFRALRLNELLAELKSATTEDMVRILRDHRSLAAAEFPALARRVDAGGDPVAEKARRLLVDWDGSIDKDAAAPTIYAAWRDRLLRALFEERLGTMAGEVLGGGANRAYPTRVIRSRLGRIAAAGDPAYLPEGKTWDEVLTESFHGAVSDLRDRLGGDPEAWRWGRVHVTAPKHPLSHLEEAAGLALDPPGAPVDGDGDTLRAASYAGDGAYHVTSTSVARYVFDLSDWEQSAWVVPFGCSGHPGHPHFANQHEAWLAGRLVPMRYDWRRIERESPACLRLRPTA